MQNMADLPGVVRRGIVMPNLRPPVTTVQQVHRHDVSLQHQSP